MDPFADTFSQLRDEVLDHLVESRDKIDRRYAQLAEAEARERFEAVLGKMYLFLATRDTESFASFARRWLAMQMSEGFPPDALMHSMVTFCDVIVQVAERQLVEPHCAEFVRAVTRMSLMLTRQVVIGIGDEVARRQAQISEVVPS